MTSKERLSAALQHQKIDRIPWSPLICGYFLDSLSGDLKKMDEVEILKYIGADILGRRVESSTFKSPLFSSLSKDTKTIIQGNIKLTTNMNMKTGEFSRTYETPLGVLKEKSVFTKTSPWIPFPVEYKIKKREDLKIYKYFIENLKYEPCFDQYQKFFDCVGEDGLATTPAPATPLLSLLQSDMGLERFYYYLSDYPQEIEELMSAMHERNKKIYGIVAESPAWVVIDYENTSTTLHSPKMYERYCLKQLNEYADILHKKNKIFLIHRCGKLDGLMDLMDRGRDDGTVDVALPPTGDLDIAKALKSWGKDKVIMGGIDPTAFTRLSPEEIKEYVKKLLKEVSPGDNFILGSADATPYGTPMENLKAVTEVIEEYGGYPLKK